LTEPNNEPETSRRPGLRHIQAQALRGSRWGLINAALGLPLAILTTVVIARELGATGFGKYALYGFVVPTAVQFSDLGMTTALIQRGAVAYGRGDTKAISLLSGQAFTWALVRWPVLFVCLAVFLDNLVAIALLGIVALASVACAGVGLVLVSTVRNAELSRLVLIAGAAASIASIGTAISGAPASVVFASGLAAQFAVLLLQIIYLRPSPPVLRACFRPRSLRGTRSDWAFGFTSYASAQLAALTLSRSELLFFGASQARERGVYAAAYTVGSRLTLPIDALYGSLGPSLAAVHGQGDAATRGAQRTLRLSATLFGMIAGPAVIAGLLAATLLFPADFDGLTSAALVLTVSSLVVSAVNPVLSLYYARRRARPALLASIVALACNLSLSAVMIPSHGLVGAVAANAVSAVIYAVALVMPLVRDRELGASVRAYARRIAMSLAGGLGAGVVIASIEGEIWPWAIGVALALGQSGAWLKFSSVLEPDDYRVLGELVPSRLRARLLRRWAPLAADRDRSGS